MQARLGVERAGALVEHTLARDRAPAWCERGVRQLVVAGGETSGAVVQALGVQRMRIGPQIDPGVPWTAAHSPAAAGEALHLALKSGNFGSTDFFTKAFAMLEQRHDERRLREEICRVGAVAASRAATCTPRAGNISVRLPDGGFLITPTDACLGALDPARLAAVDAQGVQTGGDRA